MTIASTITAAAASIAIVITARPIFPSPRVRMKILDWLI
jgi:hypothetical protein